MWNPLHPCWKPSRVDRVDAFFLVFGLQLSWQHEIKISETYFLLRLREENFLFFSLSWNCCSHILQFLHDSSNPVRLQQFSLKHRAKRFWLNYRRAGSEFHHFSFCASMVAQSADKALSWRRNRYRRCSTLNIYYSGESGSGPRTQIMFTAKFMTLYYLRPILAAALRRAYLFYQLCI